MKRKRLHNETYGVGINTRRAEDVEEEVANVPRRLHDKIAEIGFVVHLAAMLAQ